MAITINGNGTLTGVSVGGLPDGIVDTDMIAAKAATAPKLGNGSILQVVHSFKKDAFSDSSGGYAAITGLSVTIAAASTSNKLLFVCNLTYSISAQTIFHARLYDGTSEITASRSTISSTANQNAWITDYNKSNVSAGDIITNTIASYLHTPADTNSHTYNIYARSAGGNSIYINRREYDTDFGGTSSFYVYEVAA